MALCSHEGGWPCGRASGDTARERCLQGDAGEDGPQRRAQDRATDAARLVPAGPLQVDRGPGDPRDADSAQAGAEQAVGPRAQPARNFAWLRAEGRQDHADKLCRTHRRAGEGASEPSDHRAGCAPSCLQSSTVLRRVRAMSRLHEKARLLMSAPVVGTIISLTFACAIDDPSRFTSSKQVGPYLGLTPKKYQSGQTDCTGRISRHGDVSAREALYEAAHLFSNDAVRLSASKKQGRSPARCGSGRTC